MIATLGAVDAIGVDDSLAGGEAATPMSPGMSRALGSSSAGSSRKFDSERLFKAVADNTEAAVQSASRRAAQTPSSTTLAGLAHALEASGAFEAAVHNAIEALNECRRSADGGLADPVASRLALEVLLRHDETNLAVEHAKRLPLDEHTQLIIGAALAGLGRFREAHEYIDSVDAPERYQTLGYLLVTEGRDQQAIGVLRTALQMRPDDADSAVNLSIALMRMGAARKAVAMALRATRAAPGRQDVTLHYLEMLLHTGDVAGADREISTLLRAGLQPTARLLINRARAQLALHNFRPGLASLDGAKKLADAEGDAELVTEIESNLVRLRSVDSKSPDAAIETLKLLHRQLPKSDVVVGNLAQVAYRASDAEFLASAFAEVEEGADAARSAFIRYKIATLRGANSDAAIYAYDWYLAEPDNLRAVAAALVAIGIGNERWSQAVEIVDEIDWRDDPNLALLNNAAYVLAMAGRGDAAVALLEHYRAGGREYDYVLRATLGLAELARGNVATGLRLYRDAATEAGRSSDDSRSLMTAYQAIVVMQLGLIRPELVDEIRAGALPEVPLPDNWEDSPEFLRLKDLADRHGYSWPLTV